MSRCNNKVNLRSLMGPESVLVFCVVKPLLTKCYLLMSTVTVCFQETLYGYGSLICTLLGLFYNSPKLGMLWHH